VDILDIVTLISSTVLNCFHIEVSVSVNVKNPISYKEHVRKWYMDPNNPIDNHHPFMAALYHLVCLWLSD
jgi:hypothetical protein